MAVRGVITDWGGVLTPPLRQGIGQWLEADGIDADHYLEVMRPWFTGAYDGTAGPNPVHALERGELDPQDFERSLAARLRLVDGGAVPAEGMLERMFHAFHPVEEMYGLMRHARRQGLRTALLSNSWGNTYPRERFRETFDVVVISGEVRMRKPEPEIFHHALAELGLGPSECVFIDDIEHNTAAARELGMHSILHRSAEQTRGELALLLQPCGAPAGS